MLSSSRREKYPQDCTAFRVGGEDEGFDERYIEIRAVSVVAVAGCIKHPLILGSNERPGVM